MIEFCNITKQYKAKNVKKRKECTSKDILAVDNISLTIEKGSVVGLLGPNGAGKSTLIKMLLGVLYPTSGEALIENMNTFKHRTKLMKRIGIVFGQRSQLWWDLPPIESFEFVRKMYDVDKDVFQSTIEEMVDSLHAEDLIHQPVRYLSLGQRIKCEIIAALCFRPDYIILDEPTIGLDIAAKDAIRNFILHMNHQYGSTILIEIVQWFLMNTTVEDVTISEQSIEKIIMDLYVN